MGNKRERKGKQLFFHGACLLMILVFSAGCGTIPVKAVNKRFDLAERLINGGDYAGAMKEYEDVSALFPDSSPGDVAMFNTGLVWAYPDNPDRDYKKALESFDRLVRFFPQSSLVKEARVLTWAIVELQLREGRITELYEALNALEKELDAQKEKNSDLQGKNKVLEENVSALKKQINTLKETGLDADKKNKALEETIKTLKNQLNALKEIDLGIEEKKR